MICRQSNQFGVALDQELFKVYNNSKIEVWLIKSVTFLFTTGLTELCHHDGVEHDIAIEQILPGHTETYKLASSGKVTLEKTECFHTIGDVPKYSAITTASGTEVKAVHLWFF